MARAASLLGLLFVLLALVAPACGGDGPGCVDTDLDGFGEGCELGPDCDDRNAARTDDCDVVPPPDCDADPFATGCPCLPGLAECYPADPATRDVGVCTGGQAICRGGVWGLCEGAVLPRFETCEGSDQDCDGRVDEGVLSPCGACTPGCVGGVWGEGDAPFVEGEDTALTPAGRLTLRREERLEATVWIVNSAEATVSKIDAESATEVARYFSGGPEPSRVAVDWLGDAWVANRHFDGVSTVRKIAGDLARCVDRDGSGTIETASGSTPLEDDECVLLTVEVGGVGGVARALAVDGNRGPDGGAGGDLWVGLHDEEAILHLDGTSGAVVERFETPGFQPYAAVFDDFGTLWMISRDGFLLELPRFEPGAAPIVRAVPLACFLLYGLDVDARGRVFVTGFSCDSMSLYDPELERWTTIDAPPSVRGAVLDDAGRAWAAHTDGRISRVRFDPLRVEETFDLRGEGVTPIESIGAAYDAFGQVWVASSSGGGEGGALGVATRVDAESGEVTAQVPIGLAPHSQGDMTGAKRAGGFVPEGSARHVFEGCLGGGTTWLRLHLAADVPAPAEVRVEVRHAEDGGALEDVEWALLGTLPEERGPFLLDVPLGGVLEVRLTLSTPFRDGAPRIERVGLEWACPGPD